MTFSGTQNCGIVFAFCIDDDGEDDEYDDDNNDNDDKNDKIDDEYLAIATTSVAISMTI